MKDKINIIKEKGKIIQDLETELKSAVKIIIEKEILITNYEKKLKNNSNNENKQLNNEIKNLKLEITKLSKDLHNKENENFKLNEEINNLKSEISHNIKILDGEPLYEINNNEIKKINLTENNKEKDNIKILDLE